MNSLARTPRLVLTDISRDLCRAVADDEFLPYFQPLVELRTGHLVGFEVLARWSHPVRGLVQAADFIPQAEQTGLIGAITDRLLAHACCTAAAWPEHLKLTFNLSPMELRDRALPERLRAIVKRAGFTFQRLAFEITETTAFNNLDLALEITRELRSLGAGLALDDFGAGYADVRRLRTLPFDRLKIDASFVRSMRAHPEYGLVVGSMVGLGHSLGMITIAEGIETQADAAMLTNLGCDIGQGWLFGRAESGIEISAFLTQCQTRLSSRRCL